MEFRVLGPIEVSDGHRTVPLGGFRQRLVLAALLLCPNRAVTTDWLVDAVWGEAPPRTARKTLQVYISRLRSLLGADAIEATTTGYILRLDHDALDSTRFETLADQGHRLVGTDPSAAAGLLRRALLLWRGMPWGEFGDEPALQPEAQRLRERRLLALEDRLEADLGTGHAAAVVGELEGLVAEHPWRERFRAQLMLALYRAGRQSDALREFQSARRFLGEELGIEPSAELRDLEEKILLHDPNIADPATDVEFEDWRLARNPYKGIRAFRREDSADFFGRAELVATLVDRITEDRFVAVVGASGSGKSSVVMAGLIPRLSPETWTVATMVPGQDPFGALRSVLDAFEPEGIEDLETERGDDLDLLRAVQAKTTDEGPRMLLVIDQLEELFHQVGNEAVRARFMRNLVEAIEDPSTPFTVLVTLRADVLDRAMEQSPLAEFIGAGMVGVLPLRPHELEAAAARPAERAGVHTEPELIAELVSDMTDQPGALPLFQYVLTQLFEERTGPVVTRSAYRRLGGITGALSRRAEDVYQALDPDVQPIARLVFMRLVTVGAATDDSRRRTERASLEALDPGSANAKCVLDAFDEARLLTFDRNPVSGAPTVEVAHEALLREWPRLRGWLDAAREDLRHHGALVAEVAEWENFGRDFDYLLTGSRLDLYEGWGASTSLGLTDPEREFLDASITRREEEQAREEIRRSDEVQLERRSVRRLRALVVIVAIAALVAAGLTVFAVSRSHEAAANQRDARARELANASLVNLESDGELALLLAIESINVTRSLDGSVVREAETALHRAVSAHRLVATSFGAFDVEFLPDGSLVVGGEAAEVLDPVTGETLLTLPGPPAGHIESVAVSPDGNLLATGTFPDGELRLWDAASGAEVQRFSWASGAAHTDTISSITFSPDGRLVASLAPLGGGIRVWDVASGDLVAQQSDRDAWNISDTQTGAVPPVRLAFHPDGSTVAVPTTNGDVLMLDVEESVWAAPLTGHQGPVTAIRYLPDGTTIVTSGWDGSIRLWDSGGAQLAAIDAGVGLINALAVSGDGRFMLTGGNTGTARLWELRPGMAKAIATLPGYRTAVEAAAFNRDGTLAATVASGEIRLWDSTPSGRGEIAAWLGDGPVAFSPDGTRLAVADPQRRDVIVWPAAGGQPQLVLPVAPSIGTVGPGEEWGHSGAVTYSPDGRYLATTRIAVQDVLGSVTLWDAASGIELRTLHEHPFPRGVAAFSDDGRRIAAGTCALSPGLSTASVYDVASGDLVFATPLGLCVHAVDLNPTGELLAVLTEDTLNNVQVWDLAAEHSIFSVTHLPGVSGTVQFSPDGTQLLTAGSDGFGRIWDASSGQLVLRLEGHTGPVTQGSWAPDGVTVATVGSDGSTRLWDARSGENTLFLPLDGQLPHIAINPDGSRLATTAGGYVRVWTLDLDELLDIATGRLSRSLSPAECVTFHFDDCPSRP